MGTGTELIFVEGGSSDGTRAEIERQIEAHPERSVSLVVQTGKGKGDAVRAGFAAARNEVLMILDGDLTVAPEDLPKFYRALVDGRAELVNGSRLVYDLELGSMRFLNMLGNRLFSVLFRLIVGQPVKDTLCGTKVLHRDDYARIAAGRAYFGDFDPFGDFDLLLGAGEASAAHRRPPGPLPRPDVRGDEHQPLPPRAPAPADDGVRVLEVPGRAPPALADLGGVARGRRDSGRRAGAPAARGARSAAASGRYAAPGARRRPKKPPDSG